jgi:hypothetical protein
MNPLKPTPIWDGYGRGEGQQDRMIARDLVIGRSKSEIIGIADIARNRRDPEITLYHLGPAEG